ncbi:MAG: adenylate kinase [Actinomycetia bacterium]|nr:adenylate kinase [Actinomycetes bacterium]
MGARKHTANRVVLLGPPGSGKGTQGVALAQHLGVPYVSTGELLRAQSGHDTELGRAVAARINGGDLVPDEMLLDAVREPLAAAFEAGGYVLDGFPRTVSQAQYADRIGAPERVVYLAVPDDVARQRVAGRSAASRADDADPDAVEHRLQAFHSETEPLLDFYDDRGVLARVDAAQPPALVRAAILDALAAEGRP